MKKFFLSLALMLPIITFSQEKEKDTYVIVPMGIVCDKAKKVLDAIKEYDEKLVFVGMEEGSVNTISLWKNDVTGSFTVILTPKNADYSCIVSSGQTSRSI